MIASTKENRSYINTVEDLRMEIKQVHKRVKAQEQDLNTRLNKLPQESIKAAVNSVVPSFMGNFLPGRSIGIITSILGIILGKDDLEKGGWKATATDIAKQLSLYTLLKGAYTLWQKRKGSSK